jgi:hypothetical protein
VFQLDGQGTVGKSTHAGIPWLKWLRDELGDAVHFWPFDGWAPPAGKAVIAEVYPSIFRDRYKREDRSGDEQDAYATARWMSEMSERGALGGCFDPPLAPAERAVAALEGVDSRGALRSHVSAVFRFRIRSCILNVLDT